MVSEKQSLQDESSELALGFLELLLCLLPSLPFHLFDTKFDMALAFSHFKLSTITIIMKNYLLPKDYVIGY